MAISKVIYKASASATPIIWMDATPATAAAEDITAPKTALLADGNLTVGTGTGGGGGGSSVDPKDVNFYDYDGSIVASYTAQEFAALSALPANPSHTGLTAQGWNWTLANAKTYVQKYGKLNIGQMYATQSGDTEIDCVFDDPNLLSPWLAIAVNGTVEVDWGDNSAKDTMTGTSDTTLGYQQHVYAQTGSYTIKIHVASGRFTFYSTGGNFLGPLRTINAANNRAQSRIYVNTIQHVRIGNAVTTIGQYAFTNCTYLHSITIPDTVTTIGQYAFRNCTYLHSITIPNTVTSMSIGQYTFSYCTFLQSITIPNTVTSIGQYAFNYCYALQNITIPNTVTSIGQYAFGNCTSLNSVIIPDTVTSIDAYTFHSCASLQSVTIANTVTSIGIQVFINCVSLHSVTIPDTVTSIGDGTFMACYGAYEYHFQSETPPTLGANVFGGIMTGTVIYVPYSADHSILAAYQSATNWSAQASKMVEEAVP